MDMVFYNGERWGADVQGRHGEGRIFCEGELSFLIGRLIMEFGLVLDKEHPIYFNARHNAWKIEGGLDNEPKGQG